MQISLRWRHLWLAVLVLFAPPAIAEAHVKWFSDFSYEDAPRTFAQVLSPLTLGMALLSIVAIGALVVVDRWSSAQSWRVRAEDFLAAFKENSTVIIRIATGATLLLAWQAGTLLTPELRTANSFVGWGQFALALLLCLPITTPLAGAGLLALLIYAIFQVGLFHMLDYMHFAGIGIYLLLSNLTLERRAIRLPILYATTGFSLLWLGIEKLVYPGWAGYVITENPQLALGFPVAFFLTGAAFVEISLGYLVIIGLMSRSLAAVITLVFFTTTLVFGRVEVIGHTALHAILIVFLLNGPGTVYDAPITFHRRLGLRTAFAMVNFALVFSVLLGAYSFGAQREFLTAQRVGMSFSPPGLAVRFPSGAIPSAVGFSPP